MRSRQSHKVLELDQIDLRILHCLQNNARLSNVDVSERVHLSAAQCWRRIRTLERNRAITSYAAVLDREELGFGVLAFANISFDKAQHQKLADLLRVINDCPEVLECHAVTGDYDYLLKIVAPDLKAYQAFLNLKLMRGPGIVSVRSVVCLDVVKSTTSLPIDA
jgi:Lrp/AsnC family transcriptional regulator, leucine-responsive regulatory protein